MTLGSKYIMATNERKKSTYFYKKTFLGFSPISGPDPVHDSVHDPVHDSSE